MGHYLNALITRLPVDERRAAELGVAVVFEGGFAILPIVPESLDVWAEELGVKYEPFSDKIQVDCSVTHRLAADLGITDYSLIETEYFGGVGTQSASYYRNGEAVIQEVAINDVLHRLGVTIAAGRTDEFDTIGLPHFRKTDDDRFWDAVEYGRRVGNILVGKRRFKY